MWTTARTVLLDFGSIILAFGGVIHEEWTGHASVPLLVVYTTILGVPGVAKVLAPLVSRSTPPIGAPSSGSPSDSSSSPSSSS